MKTFGKALQGKGFPFTAELDLAGGIQLPEMLQRANVLASSVDAIQFDDRIESCCGIAPLALASLLLREGIDAVTGMNCRDRNRIALQSDLLGMRALGVSSLILDSGDHANRSGSKNGKPVRDTSCRELIAMAQAMNEEEWPHGRHEFVMGIRESAVADLGDRNLQALTARADAGARFLQIRHCSDQKLLRASLQALVEARLTWSLAVIVTLAPDTRRKDSSALAEQMQSLSELPGVSGIHLRVSDNPEAVAKAIEVSGLRAGPFAPVAGSKGPGDRN